MDSKQTFENSAVASSNHERSLYTKNGFFERRRVFTKLLNQYRAKKASNVLDIGCGPGNYFDIYKKFDLQITGVDYAQSQLDLARKQYPDAKLLCADVTKQHAQQKYDVITAIGLLQTIDKLEDFFSGCEKLLAKNGIMIISFLNNASVLPKKLRSTNWKHYTPADIFKVSKLKCICTKRIYVAPHAPMWASKLLYSLQIPGLNHTYMMVLKHEK